MHRFIIFSLLLTLLAPALTIAAPVEQSVVKIVNQYNRFSWYTPWASGGTGKGTGSGFVISNKRIMTNAHVVSDSALLLVFFHNDPTPYPASVIAIGHDCDLALLELHDPNRLNQVPPLAFDGLPALRSEVFTYGYPAGGQLISSTAGVVSRIEVQQYVHSGTDQHLTVQTDAAINPGNSGGPVIQNGHVVGVAFQGNQNLENMGFFIPTPIIQHFLDDLKDGTYHGFPELGLITANLKNPAARAYSGMKADESGMRIDFISSGSSAEGLLHEGDIITALAGHNVANDGTVNWKGLRLEALMLTDLLQMGDTVPIHIIRNQKRLSLELPLNFYNPTPALANLYNHRPDYYIYAGLVFAPLNRETLKTYSNNWQTEVPQELMYEFFFKPLIERTPFDQPRIIQLRRLDHAVNVEEANNLYRIIDTVNDHPIHTLQDLATAFETCTNAQHVINYRYGNKITVLDRKAAEAAHSEILNNYAVPKDRSL